jgi:hypothetical protein
LPIHGARLVGLVCIAQHLSLCAAHTDAPLGASLYLSICVTLLYLAPTHPCHAHRHHRLALARPTRLVYLINGALPNSHRSDWLPPFFRAMAFETLSTLYPPHSRTPWPLASCPPDPYPAACHGRRHPIPV